MEDDPAYDIAIARVSGHAPVSDDCLAGAIRATLTRHQAAGAQISVALVDDSRIADLNETHLDRRAPTDVLAFDLREHGNGRPPHAAGGPVEGEIVVSVDAAAREAKARGHSVEAEVTLYVIHGTLHLLGYDDSGTAEAARMHEMEDQILTSMGMGPVYRRAPRVGPHGDHAG